MTSMPQLDSANDFALDVDGFHDELRRLRETRRVAYVPFHGSTAYLLTRYRDVEQPSSTRPRSPRPPRTSSTASR